MAGAVAAAAVVHSKADELRIDLKFSGRGALTPRPFVGLRLWETEPPSVQVTLVQVQLGIKALHDPLAFVFGIAGTDRGECARL